MSGIYVAVVVIRFYEKVRPRRVSVVLRSDIEYKYVVRHIDVGNGNARFSGGCVR